MGGTHNFCHTHFREGPTVRELIIVIDMRFSTGLFGLPKTGMVSATACAASSARCAILHASLSFDSVSQMLVVRSAR